VTEWLGNTAAPLQHRWCPQVWSQSVLVCFTFAVNLSQGGGKLGRLLMNFDWVIVYLDVSWYWFFKWFLGLLLFGVLVGEIFGWFRVLGVSFMCQFRCHVRNYLAWVLVGLGRLFLFFIFVGVSFYFLSSSLEVLAISLCCRAGDSFYVALGSCLLWFFVSVVFGLFL
jgi:hypothetical protein